MAIQTINLTVPGGDTPRSANTKINANFSDQTNAASRLVGTGAENVCLVKDASIAVNSDVDIRITSGMAGSYDLNTRLAGDRSYAHYTVANSPSLGDRYLFIRTIATDSGGGNPFQIATPSFGATGLATRNSKGTSGGSIDPESWTPWAIYYGTHNTTKEEGTGYLVASSPVLKVQHDSFEKVHEAEQLDIDIKHIKTGVYEITGTTGLREGDGWNLKPPKDVNGNVLCICEATEKDGVVTINTYAKRFDFETVSIVADYDKPLDIPEGETVMLRFNDLPIDNLPAL